MNDFLDDLNEIFQEKDESQELKKLLSSLRELLPDLPIYICPFEKVTDGFSTEGFIPSGAVLRGISSKLKENDNNITLDDNGSRFHGIKIPDTDTFMVTSFPQNLIRQHPDIISLLISNTVNLLKAANESKVNSRMAEQYKMEKEVMSRKHSELVETNHEQYLMLRKREQDYSRLLEQEIGKQTEELKKKNLQLIRASEMKSAFIANMSHELRTPMNAIMGFIDLLLESKITDEQRDYAENVRRSASHLLDLINDILDISKIEAGKVEIIHNLFDLQTLLKNILSMFEAQAKKRNNKLQLKWDDKLPKKFSGDETRIKQIVVNLLGNAVKFTENGFIDVEIKELARSFNKVIIEISVSDTGIGIPKERQSAIFDKFTQADDSTTRKYGGTGLGLSICRQLAELMEGTLDLESEPGHGSCFSLTMGLESQEGKDKESFKTASAPECQKETVKTVSEKTQKAKILLVEDNKVNQKLFSVMIKKMGFETDIAENGLVALERIKSEKYDLILMDIQMPEMDGHTATIKIREIEKSDKRQGYKTLASPDIAVTIIGLTAHARKEDELKCYDSGMTDYLSKPVSKPKLEAMIKKHLTHQ